MITFNVSPIVINLIARHAPEGVTPIDVSRAVSSRVREAINSLGFAIDAKALSKLAIDAKLSTARFSEKHLAVVSDKDRPWLAIVRLSQRIEAFEKEFPGMRQSNLPNTPEMETLKLWAGTLRPRVEKPAPKQETPAPQQNEPASQQETPAPQNA